MLNLKTEDTGGPVTNGRPPSQNGHATANGLPNGNTIVHVVQTAANEGLDELFLAVMAPSDGQSRLPHQVPMRQRRLPPSFFRPPSAASSANHSRESSLDGGYQSNDTNGGLVNYASSGLAIIHPRANSSPADLTPAQLLGGGGGSSSGAQPPTAAFGSTGGIASRPTAEAGRGGLNGVASGNGGGHFRQMSYDLEQIPLPGDWEMSYTKSGERYFLNHKDKTTTWEDPRKTMMEEMLRRNSLPLIPPVSATVVATPAPPIQQPIIQQSPIIQPGGGGGHPMQSDIDITTVPLPDAWEMSRNEVGDLYFISHRDETTSWFHPAVPRNLQMKRVQAYQQSNAAQPPPFVNRAAVAATTTTVPPATPPSGTTNDLVAALRNMNTSCQPASASGGSSLSGSQQNLRDLELERERMRQRQEEILQNSLLTANGSNLLLSSCNGANDHVMTNGHSPFMLQSAECHSRQESSDSGLDLGGGSSSNASYSMPHTPDDFLRMSSGVGSLLNGNPSLNGNNSSSTVVTSGGGMADTMGFDSMLDLETETMEFMNMEMDNMDILSNVEELLNSNKDNIMTWL